MGFTTSRAGLPGHQQLDHPCGNWKSAPGAFYCWTTEHLTVSICFNDEPYAVGEVDPCDLKQSLKCESAKCCLDSFQLVNRWWEWLRMTQGLQALVRHEIGITSRDTPRGWGLVLLLSLLGCAKWSELEILKEVDLQVRRVIESALELWGLWGFASTKQVAYFDSSGFWVLQVRFWATNLVMLSINRPSLHHHEPSLRSCRLRNMY